MKVGNSIGVLHIDSKSLRNSLLPVTARTLDAVKVVLLAAAREETVTVLANFQQRIRTLQDRPDQLDAFVDFMKLFEEMGDARKAAMAEVRVPNARPEPVRACDSSAGPKDRAPVYAVLLDMFLCSFDAHFGASLEELRRNGLNLAR